MAERISLALVFHNHQPVGNFGWVIEDVFSRAYEPMIGALERHPHVRLGLHYTGPLLEWMAGNRPDSLDRLRNLVDRGQVEMLGGAQYEPILVALPRRDRIGQLVRMRDEVERLFGAAPTGAWLAERVWEPSLPADLVDSGYRYTVLDDNHLRAASVADDDMWGTYTTDDQGRMLTIFGTEKGLRYLIPFRPVPELIAYLRDAATEDGRRLGIMGDDGEKFGAWPGTYEHCWTENNWIDACFSAFEENEDWLTMVTPSEWLAREAPIGRVYVPASSYVEMTEWALPADQGPVFHRLLSEAVETGSPAAQFLRGGLWRNFQARYREINDLHKQMLRVSAAVDAMPAGERRDRALDHLYRGQSNDCYWHGLFGGIYIVHMRMATLAELIAADDLAAGQKATSGVADYDLDGLDEVLIGTLGQSVLIDVAEGAGIGSWDLRASRVALASVMRRRPEAYHQQLREFEAAKARGRQGDGRTPTSIHEQLMVKEEGLSAALEYDDHERRSGLVRVLGGDGDAVGDFVSGAWRIEKTSESAVLLSRSADGLSVTKSIAVAGGRRDGSLSLSVEMGSVRNFEGVLEIEWNINLTGGGGNPQAYYRWGSEEARHDTAGAVAAGTHLSMGNEYEGVDIAAEPEPPAEQEWYSVDTVSNSEAGFERMHQGSCLTQRWPLVLAAGESKTFSTIMRVTQSRDRSVDEELDSQSAGAAQRDQTNEGSKPRLR